jgi:hypothetical protein
MQPGENMADEKQEISDQNKGKNFQGCESCPNCGSQMKQGTLQVAGDHITSVYIEDAEKSENEIGYVPLSVCFCLSCGHVSLIAG